MIKIRIHLDVIEVHKPRRQRQLVIVKRGIVIMPQRMDTGEIIVGVIIAGIDDDRA